MSHASRPGRAFTALLLAALALWPLAALGSRCEACPQPRAVAAHPCCHPGAQASSEETGRWTSGCCEPFAVPVAPPAREVSSILGALGAPAVAILAAAETRLPDSETASDRLLGHAVPRRALPLYTLFSVLLI